MWGLALLLARACCWTVEWLVIGNIMTLMWHHCNNNAISILRLQCESVEVSLVQVMACRLFGAKPLPEPVEGPVIWKAMTAMLRPCNNNAVITVITTRVVFIQFAKCADRRTRTMGHAGSETCFVWNARTVVFILVFLSCSSQWPQGQPAPLAGFWVRAGYPNQETKWRWSDHRSHQLRYAISLTHSNDQRHIWIHLYLTDRICNGKSFQILGFYSAFMHVLLFVCKTQGDVWGNLVNYMAIIQIVPNDLNSM